MGGYIQVGQVACRDPVTGDFLREVPLFIRAEDKGEVPEALDVDLRALFVEKVKAYKAAEAGQK